MFFILKLHSFQILTLFRDLFLKNSKNKDYSTISSFIEFMNDLNLLNHFPLLHKQKQARNDGEL